MSRAREFADLAGSADAGGLTGRNLIINGAMQVAQRGAGPTAIGSGYYTLDRFQTNKDNDGAFTNEQSTDHPNGAGNSLKWAVTTADTSVAAGQFLFFSQKIEAQDLQHLLYGTSSAKSLTLSFWVKSNKTGTYTIFVRKLDSTAYHFVHEYTISSANTWEKKEITISPTAGSTSFITSAAGVIDNDNGTGLQIGWNLAFGSTYNGATNNAWSSNTNHYATSNQVNWMDSTSNTFYLTEVQLEVGETATPFEHRSYGDELRRCQRYYQQYKNYQGNTGNTTSNVLVSIAGLVPMRASFTVSSTGTLKITSYGVDSYTQSSTSVSYSDTARDPENASAYFLLGNFSGLTAQRQYNSYDSSNYVTFDAEL